MPGAAWLALGALLAAAGAGAWIWRTRLAPLAAVRRWAWRMRGGDLSARVPAASGGMAGELAADLNVLAEMIQTLSRRTEEQLEAFGAHTTRKERARLSGELHDSLAQTLASVRMQVRLLDATLQRGDEERAWQELEKIQDGLEEADRELRELIAHFRAPVDEGGLVPALERAVERFRRACPEVRALLQTRWEGLELSDEAEFQLARVAQEALANVRKHARARTVRVLLAGDAASGHCRLLVEDDGSGFAVAAAAAAGGGHIGLGLLRDRAARLGGRLQIESEPGEGTRVALEFEARPAAPARRAA